MTALTGSWTGLVVSAGNLDSTTYGQGTSFPSSWDITRLFWRSDLKRLYYNKGTLGTPVWEGADIPVGSINMYAGSTTDVPSGWLLCNGGAVSRTTYAQLFAVLDTEYGVGDGSTTFNVPDFVTTNKFPRAATNDAGRGTTGGESTHVISVAEMPAHDHDYSDPGHTHSSNALKNIYAGSGGGGGGGATAYAATINSSSTGITINSQGSGTAHENKPPFLDVHFIIAV